MGVPDRAVYERRFGSWSNAIEKCGIDNRHRILLTYFKNYCGEEPIHFLKVNLGENNEFTNEQYKIINKIKLIYNNENIALETLGKYIANHMNKEYIKRNFKFASVAIIAAGYTPTVNFCTGNKYIAKDGHKCDSLKEVIVDDFLSENGIFHEVHVKYPGSNMICDFKCDNIYIEFAGLLEKKNYRDKIDKKIRYCNTNQIKLLIIESCDELSLIDLLYKINNNKN